MNNFLFEKETFTIIGLCMDIHRVLGQGFSEIVYKDAMMYEAALRQLSIEREKRFNIEYKGFILPHSFYADFVFFDNIIVEVKAAEGAINSEAIAQTLNYLKASDLKIGLLINFGRKSLEYRRLIF
jgi:GxxExxY protein